MTRTVLGNGLTVLVREDHSAPVVAIVTYVKAGYFDESDDVVGIAHVLEHMYFKGTPTRGVGEIARQTKASGGYLNAHTIYDNTTYYTVLPSSGFRQGLEIQADAYARSLIDDEELARELEVIIQEAKRKADNPSAVSVETLYELLHDSHRIRRWRIGREPGLRALRRDHLMAFYRNYYRPANTILCIAGDVNPTEALASVKDLYGPLEPGEPEREPGPAERGAPPFRYRELSGDVTQSQVAIGWRTVPTLHEDSVPLDVLSYVLSAGRSSRLYRAVREKSLVSSIGAYNYSPTELGVFVIQAEGKPAHARDAIAAIGAQVAAIKANGVTDEELRRVRSLFESRWARRLETMEGQANHLAEFEALGGWELGDDYFDRFLAAGADDVQSAARRYLDDGAGMVVYRPDSAEQVAKGELDAAALLFGRAPEALPAIEVSAPASPAARSRRLSPQTEEAGVLVYRAPNGIPILVRRKPGATMAQLAFYAVGGSTTNDSSSAGLASLAARTMVKGTRSRSAAQIALEAELIGGSISAATGRESSGWSISVPPSRLPAAIELLSDVVQRPVFPEAETGTERAIAISEIERLRDDMYAYPMRLAMEAAYGAHPYGIPVGGTEATLRRLTVDDLMAWHARHVLVSRCAIGIVGDFDPDEMASAVAERFSEITLSNSSPLPGVQWPDEITVRAESREKAQTAVTLGFPGPARKDHRRFAAHLLAGVASGLGGRFFDELRDRQSLAYTVHASSSEHSAAGMFMAYIATSPEKEDAARSGLLGEFRRFIEGPVSDDELTRAKTYALGVHAIRQESGASLLGDMMDAYLFGGGLGELSTFEEDVRGVTGGDILELARMSFDPDRRVEGVVRGTGKAV